MERRPSGERAQARAEQPQQWRGEGVMKSIRIDRNFDVA